PSELGECRGVPAAPSKQEEGSRDEDEATQKTSGGELGYFSRPGAGAGATRSRGDLLDLHLLVMLAEPCLLRLLLLQLLCLRELGRDLHLGFVHGGGLGLLRC